MENTNSLYKIGPNLSLEEALRAREALTANIVQVSSQYRKTPNESTGRVLNNLGKTNSALRDAIIKKKHPEYASLRAIAEEVLAS